MGANIEKLAADALLERGVGFRIPAPFFYRIFGKKVMTLKVRRLHLGTLIHLAYLEDLGEPEPVPVGAEREQVIRDIGGKPAGLSYKTIVGNMKPVCMAVAACLLNDPVKIRLFRWWLWRTLRRRCTADQLREIALWLFAYGRPESFLNTTKLIRKMNVTMPRNLGLTTERG